MTAARRRGAAIGLGLFLGLASLYALSGPGRIDIIDGQVRFEMSASLVRLGVPAIEDPALFGVPGRGGRRFSGYAPAPAVAAVPLVWLGRAVGDPYGETSRFLFSFTSALFAGGIGWLLFAFYRRLDLSARAAVAWVLVSALATLLWPVATSTFDQAQQAFVLLLAVFLAHGAGRRGSLGEAAAAGLCAGLLLLFQEIYAALVPLLGLAVLERGAGEPDRRRGWARYAVFHLAAGVGLALWAQYNLLRFGKLLMTGKLSAPNHPPVLGDTLIGLAGLLASPGKSIFLFSPPLLLALLGLGALVRRHRLLGWTVAATSVAYLLIVASLTFFGGDWAWGPRYLVAVSPLLALAFPFAAATAGRRRLAAALAALGVTVQLLALSVDHQRWFFARKLPAFFWVDPLVYFRSSQLLSRPGEVLALAEGVPETARRFVPAPYPRSLTYCIFGSREVWTDPLWLDRYAVFHLPRPWPLWMPAIERSREVPIPYRRTAAVLGLGLLLGTGTVLLALRREDGAQPRRSAR